MLFVSFVVIKQFPFSRELLLASTLGLVAVPLARLRVSITRH